MCQWQQWLIGGNLISQREERGGSGTRLGEREEGRKAQLLAGSMARRPPPDDGTNQGGRENERERFKARLVWIVLRHTCGWHYSLIHFHLYLSLTLATQSSSFFSPHFLSYRLSPPPSHFHILPHETYTRTANAIPSFNAEAGSLFMREASGISRL